MGGQRRGIRRDSRPARPARPAEAGTRPGNLGFRTALPGTRSSRRPACAASIGLLDPRPPCRRPSSRPRTARPDSEARDGCRSRPGLAGLRAAAVTASRGLDVRVPDAGTPSRAPVRFSRRSCGFELDGPGKPGDIQASSVSGYAQQRAPFVPVRVASIL